MTSLRPTHDHEGADPIGGGEFAPIQTAASLAAGEVVPHPDGEDGLTPGPTFHLSVPNQKLLPALLDELEKVDPAAHAQLMLLPFGPIPAYAMDDTASAWWNSEEAKSRLEQLCEALSETDPEGFLLRLAQIRRSCGHVVAQALRDSAIEPEWVGAAVTEGREEILKGEDYVLPPDRHGVWITVDDISVRVARHMTPGAVPGVTVSLFPLNAEMLDPLGSATAYLDEAQALRDEFDPVDVDSSREAAIKVMPRAGDIGYGAWVQLQNQKLSGEDARLILTDAVLAELRQGRVFNKGIFLAAMKDPRPELVVAAMTWAASEFSPIHSTERETDTLCRALEAVFQDACRGLERCPEWTPVARVAAGLYCMRGGELPLSGSNAVEQAVARDVRATLNLG